MKGILGIAETTTDLICVPFNAGTASSPVVIFGYLDSSSEKWSLGLLLIAGTWAMIK